MPFMAMYPPDFARAVRQHWPSWLRKQISALPPDDVIIAVAEIAYQVSFTTEEGRHLAFRVVIGEPSDLGDDHRLFPAAVRFAQPRPLTIPELRRLAPASDPRRLLVGVAGPSHALEIWGLLDIGSARHAQLEGDVSDRSIPKTPDGLAIAVTAPGVLQASFGDTFLLELANGTLRCEYPNIAASSPQNDISVFGQGPVADFFLDVQKRFLSIVGRPEYDPPLDLGDVMQAFGGLFERLLLAVSSKRHGGALLVVPSKPHTGCMSSVLTFHQTSAGKPDTLLNVKYPCDDNRLWLSLQGAVGARSHYRTLAGFVVPKANTTAGEMKGAAEAKFDRAEEFADVVDYIVSLTAVDGAVVLTDDLRLLGFGTEILPGVDVPAVFVATDDLAKEGEERRSDSYGTRHRSAFRFCAAMPSALAFVISQDGDAKAVRVAHGRVNVWPHILEKRLSGKPGFLPFVRGLRGQT